MTEKNQSDKNQPQGSIDDPIDTTDTCFKELMGEGITPIKQNRANISRKVNANGNSQYRRVAAQSSNDRFDQGLSNELRTLVDSEEELIFAQPGIQLRMMKKLRKGHIPWEEGLDLHGYSVDRAREELGLFIRQATYRDQRCVIVVHGKAHSEDGTPALLKSYVNDWLQQMQQVLAFVSAQPKDGGTGALYVLLKNKNK